MQLRKILCKSFGIEQDDDDDLRRMSYFTLRIDDDKGIQDIYENGDILIRSAQIEELDMVKEFVCRVHVEVSSYNEESRLQQIEDLPVDFPTLFSEKEWQGSKTWLCFDKKSKNQLIGAIGVKHHSDRIAEIAFFFLESNARGKGIGRTLLRHAITWIRQVEVNGEKMCNGIDLLTLRKYMEPAINLYQSEGFTIYLESRSKYYDLIRMRMSW